MTEALLNAANALESLANAVRDGWAGEMTLLEQWGWNCPALTRHDLYGMAKRLSDRLREVSPDALTPEIDQALSQLPNRCALFQQHTLQYLYNGNAVQAFPAYQSLLRWVSDVASPVLLPEVDWRDVEQQNLMPRALLRRLRSIDVQTNSAENKAIDIDKRIGRILEAYEIAENFPTDMADIQEARENLRVITQQSLNDGSKIQSILGDFDKKFSEISDKSMEANKLVENCEDAYSAATTKGLGQSFDDRAKSLNRSMYYWVTGLVTSLLMGGIISWHRIDVLKDIILDVQKLDMIWPQVWLSIFSVAAPIWFAWISTKQIGQRFRLAEDYAYKASVAKAYEGYRREASRNDPASSSRLFQIAIDRLGEAPLRFVELENHGSPLHEVIKGRFGLFRGNDRKNANNDSGEAA